MPIKFVQWRSMREEYRRRFVDADEAKKYDALFVEVEEQSYAFTVLWHFEKKFLDTIVTELRATHDTIDYLDFAAGTGRIIAHLEDKVDVATAIEIAPAMLDVAATRVKRARLLCVDVTEADTPPEGRYDLITAFRFFLKADPQLRLSAMKALASRLKDERSLLVFNNHGHAPRLPVLRWLWSRPRGAKDSMTDKEVRNLVRQTGLRIDRVTGYAQVPARIAKIFSTTGARKLEALMSKWPLVPRLGIYQLYVVRLDRGR